VHPILPASVRWGLRRGPWRKNLPREGCEKIQHGDDHVEVANKYGLREVLGKLLVLLRKADPEARRGIAQALRIELGQVSAGLDALVKAGRS